MGFLERGHIVETDRQGLVAGFVGQTAIKTNEKIKIFPEFKYNKNNDLSPDFILVKGDDEMLNTYFSQIYGRLNKIMRNIGNLYYKNRDSKNYLNSVKSYDDESGELLDYENSSALLLSLAESASS